MPKPRTWPATATERHDRNTIVHALMILGRRQLRFGADDVRREVLDNLHGTLHHPGQLARHLRALVPVTIVPVAQPLAAFELPPTEDAPGDGAAGDDSVPARGHRSRHLYALTEREAELAQAAPDLTDPARMYVALWVAVRAFGVDAVPTNAVTQVCRAIPELTVDLRQQITMRLTNLSDRAAPLARTEEAFSIDGERQRWTRWRPVGRPPEDPAFQAVVPLFDDWVDVVRALRGGAADLGAYATANDLAIDLVALAIASTKSPQWPEGHPVTMEHIRAVCAEREDARALAERLRRMGTSIAKVLGDASKVRIAGRARAQRRVVKVGAVYGGQACYDVPALGGFEARALYVPYQNILEATRHDPLEALAAEHRAAVALARTPASPQAGSVLAAMAAVRVLFVARELAALERQMTGVLNERQLLSSKAQGVLLRKADALEQLRRRLGVELDDAEADARLAVSRLGLDLHAIVARPAPVLIGDDYKEWVPLEVRKGRTGPELMAHASAVRRRPNPAFVRRPSSDPREAASTGLDRVDGLIHLAERQTARTLSFLQSGARLLGATLRDGTLIERLLATGEARWWSASLAALALLGNLRAEEVARDTLADGHAPGDRVVHSLYALAVMRRGEISLPTWLLDRGDPAITRAVRAVLDAKRTGGWLLPG